MNRLRLVVPALAVALLATARAAAQSEPSTDVVRGEWQVHDPFAVVDGASRRMVQGDWDATTPLFRYVQAHPQGNYVVFQHAGTLYRLDGAAAMQEVRTLYAPLIALAAQQDALARAQKPLGEDQGRLGEQQQHASTPEDHGRVGQAQGAIGRTQGEIGEAQGEIGRQQGQAARVAYLHMQELFSRCLAAGSCRRAGA